MKQVLHTGGCQCGAVRYALHAEPTDPHICHCRMCQKAFGSFFAPLVGIALEDITWTRGLPRVFSSSEATERGFCGNCGTPLTFHYVFSDRISVSIGSLDDPKRVAPARQYGIESRAAYFDKLAALPGEATELPQDHVDQLKSRQHPDHDTAQWHIEPSHAAHRHHRSA
jgi:hypothetical protein